MTFPAYVLSPLYGVASPDDEPCLHALAILHVDVDGFGAPVVDDRSVALTGEGDDRHDKLAQQIAAALSEPLPIIGWRILPLLLPCLRAVSAAATPLTALALAEALGRCFQVGAEDAALPYGGAAAVLEDATRDPSELALDRYYEWAPAPPAEGHLALAVADAHAALAAYLRSCKVSAHG